MLIMYNFSFVLSFLATYLINQSYSQMIRLNKIRLIFRYYPKNSSNATITNITGDLFPRINDRNTYVLTGNTIDKYTLNISSIACMRIRNSPFPYCRENDGRIYIILEGMLNNGTVRVHENQYLMGLLKQFISEAHAVVLTCTIEDITDGSKDFNHDHLSKTGLFGIIFICTFTAITFALCLGWCALMYYRRFHNRRMQNKLKKALALSTQQMLDKSPVIIFNTKNDYLDDEPMCAICLELFINNEKIRKLVCSHYFHIACIDPWLITHQSCPLCNQNILQDSIPSISARITEVNEQSNNQVSPIS